MDSVWSRIFRGIALAADGLADLSYGGENVQTSTQDAAEGSAPPQDAVTAFLSDLAQKLAGRQADGATPDPGADVNFMVDQALAASEHVIPADRGDLPVVTEPKHDEPDDSIIPPAENGVPLLPCPEMDRQKKEARRRAKFRSDPVQAMSAASYWLLHLAEQPWRAEDWTRSIECLPGSASHRFTQAMVLGMSELQLYATYYDECMRALQQGKDKAEQMRNALVEIGPEDARSSADLLDIDRIGRILFWLGDRPDVEALTSVPPATGDVRLLGPDHIDGEPGDSITPPEGVEELLSIEELEQLHPLPQEDTQEITVPPEAEGDAG